MLQFRRHRWVANDRSGLDLCNEVLFVQVGPVAEAGDHVQAGVLRLNLAIWSDVTSVIMIVSLTAGLASLVRVCACIGETGFEGLPAAVVIGRRTNIVSLRLHCPHIMRPKPHRISTN